MKDRELLEYAAKAAGIKVLQQGNGYWTIEVHDRGLKGWNPLIDDGDALRLAVKLEMDICYTPHTPMKIAVWSEIRSDFIEEERGQDPYAATRRAIVRAAAEIGKAMP